MRTTADDKVDSAVEHINSAVESISDVVVSKCYGYDEYSREYRKNLAIALQELLELRETLER